MICKFCKLVVGLQTELKVASMMDSHSSRFQSSKTRAWTGFALLICHFQPKAYLA